MPAKKDHNYPIDTLHSYNINPENKEIFLFGEESYIPTMDVEDSQEPGIEYSIANRFIRNLTYLQHHTDETITIHMKTNGGHWQEGMAIFSAIKASKNNIEIINYTHARSMSSLIFLAADKRYMMPYSVYMFHEGTIHTGGTGRQFRTEFEQNQIAHEQMMTIYINHLEQQPYWQNSTRTQIRKWLDDKMLQKEEVYLSAEEAVDFGFADEIITQY